MESEDSGVVSSGLQKQERIMGDSDSSDSSADEMPLLKDYTESEYGVHDIAQAMEKDDPEEATQRVAEDQELSDDLKREMLADICKGITVLRCESDASGECCHVYLVGTAHVSQDSCREVQAVIRLLKPQVVFLELCDKRSFMLVSTNFHIPTVNEMLSMWREKRMNILGILYSWFLAKVAAKMDVFPGSEFRVAFEEAKACGALVILGDRDVQAISLPSVEDLQQMIQELQEVDMLTLAFQELSKSFPTLMETLVYERDMFMAAELRGIAQHHSSIVAVVGKGHVSGIAKNWDQEISMHALMEVPSTRTLWTRSFKFFLIGALIVFLVAFLSSTALNKTQHTSLVV